MEAELNSYSFTLFGPKNWHCSKYSNELLTSDNNIPKRGTVVEIDNISSDVNCTLDLGLDNLSSGFFLTDSTGCDNNTRNVFINVYPYGKDAFRLCHEDTLPPSADRIRMINCLCQSCEIEKGDLVTVIDASVKSDEVFNSFSKSDTKQIYSSLTHLLQEDSVGCNIPDTLKDVNFHIIFNIASSSNEIMGSPSKNRNAGKKFKKEVCVDVKPTGTKSNGLAESKANGFGEISVTGLKTFAATPLRCIVNNELTVAEVDLHSIAVPEDISVDVLKEGILLKFIFNSIPIKMKAKLISEIKLQPRKDVTFSIANGKLSINLLKDELSTNGKKKLVSVSSLDSGIGFEELENRNVNHCESIQEVSDQSDSEKVSHFAGKCGSEDSQPMFAVSQTDELIEVEIHSSQEMQRETLQVVRLSPFLIKITFATNTASKNIIFVASIKQGMKYNSVKKQDTDGILQQFSDSPSVDNHQMDTVSKKLIVPLTKIAAVNWEAVWIGQGKKLKKIHLADPNTEQDEVRNLLL